MSKKTIYIAIVIVLISGAVVAVKHKKSELANLQSASKDTVTAKIYEPKTSHIKLYLDVLAVVMSDREISFTPRFGARVESIADIGSRIKKGGVVVKLDDSELKADIESAKSDLSAKEANYQNLQEIHDRTLELLAIGGASKEQSNSEASGLLSAKSAVQSAKARVTTLQNSISYTSLYAPFDGIVSQKLANSGDFMPAGKNVLVFTGFDGKYLQIKLPQDENAKEIVYNDKSYPLQKTNSSPDSLVTYSARINNLTQSVGAKISCKVSVFDANATFLPNDTVIKRADGNYVIVFENDTAKTQKVNLLSQATDGYATDTKLDGKKILLAKPDSLLRALFGTKIEAVK